MRFDEKPLNVEVARLNLRFSSQDGWEWWQTFMRWAQVECDCDFKLQFCAQMTEAPAIYNPKMRICDGASCSAHFYW
jgi:hypothetical protein